MQIPDFKFQIDTDSFFQLHYRRPLAAFVVWRRGHARDECVLTEIRSERLAQPAGAVPVHDPEPALVGEQRRVQKLLRARERIVHRRANQDQLRRRKVNGR